MKTQFWLYRRHGVYYLQDSVSGKKESLIIRDPRQAELIRSWKPWEQATGPRTDAGKARVSRNAWRGGGWAALRELRRQINAEIRQARELVAVCGDGLRNRG